MHGADVVDHVGVGHDQTYNRDEEIQSKQHSHRSPHREVHADPEEREIFYPIKKQTLPELFTP